MDLSQNLHCLMPIMGNSKDNELLEIFLEEATDLIASLSSILRDWESDLQNFSKVAELKRDLHTLKGSARMVGQSQVGKLAHEMETFSEALVKAEIKIDRNTFELVNLGLDHISVMIDAIRKQETPPSPDELIARFLAVAQGKGDVLKPAATKTKQKKEKEKEREKEKITEEVQEKAEVPLQSSSTAPSAPTAPAHTAEEVVRIRLSLLETLNNLSTENNTLRVGFEQHVSSFGSFLRELRTDAKRLEGQLNNVRSEIQSYISQAELMGRVKDIAEEDNLERKRYVNLEQMNHVLRETSLDFINSMKGMQESQSAMETLLLNQTRITTELQHRLSDTRLVPFESIVPRLSRIARQVSSELKKQVDFRVLKSQGEMDRTVLEHLIPSLEHILRNALDHGIESVEERRKRGKPEVGKIEVNFTRAGSIAAIEVKDDGGGIDPNIIRKKALKLGMIKKDQKVSDEEVIRYILEPGFSTREAITEVSGRGVGMDVVANAVKEMGGTLNILSEVGLGTRMIIRFPFTTSLNRILLFKSGSEVLGILLTDIAGIVTITTEEFRKIIQNVPPTLKSGDSVYHLHYLETLLVLDGKEVFIPCQNSCPVILLPDSEFPLALMVESLLYSRELVVQALGAQFKLAEVCSGATFLGNGQVVYILDPEALRKKAKGLEAQTNLKIEFTTQKSPRSQDKRLVMVVDDSASARAVATRLLEKYQYQVVTAKDGMDALLQLDTYHPSLMLIDVDMPRMDGFELATTLRSDSRYQNIPIIMLTALANVERRKLAKEMKLDGFLAKPYEETQLILAIQALIGTVN